LSGFLLFLFWLFASVVGFFALLRLRVDSSTFYSLCRFELGRDQTLFVCRPENCYLFALCKASNGKETVSTVYTNKETHA
jgi:hypothetical protein